MPLALRTWDARIREDRQANLVALVAGVIFVVAGLAKFFAHRTELDAFRRFDLPSPEVLVILVGLAEAGGGVLLVARRLVVPTALALAVTMLVAIGVSGIAQGDVIPSLTLAPALLVAMLFLLYRALRA